MIEPQKHVEARRPSEDEAKLVSLFDDLEWSQLEFLDAAAKRITEICTAVLTLLFALSAFGDEFPPPYLAGSTYNRALAIFSITTFVIAMIASLTAIVPRRYSRYRHNLTEMRRGLNALIDHKLRWVRIAGGALMIGVVGFTILVIAVLLNA